MASRVMARRGAEVIDAAEIEKFVLGGFEVDESGKIHRVRDSLGVSGLRSTLIARR